MARVYADTNIFYNLGAGRITKEQALGEAGRELWATPVNVLELVGAVVIKDWEARKAAANAILKYSDGMALDPESHLVMRLDEAKEVPQPIWKEICKAIVNSANPKELENGVPDFVDRVTREVNVSLASATRSSHYDDFADNMAQVCDSLIPGYYAAYRQKQELPKLKHDDRTNLRHLVASAPFLAAILKHGVLGRYQLITSRDFNMSTNEAAFRAIGAFTPYTAVYGAYVRELSTAGRKPDPNDWGDLELFLYLQDNDFVSTSEKKWWLIADLAHFGNRVVKVPS
jgi:hypothetical protein